MSTEDAPLAGYEKLQIFPKLTVNGFPKSGLHLALLMALCLVEEQAHSVSWIGTFEDHSWTTNWFDDMGIYRRIARNREGAYLKGHLGYRDDIAEFMDRCGIQMSFAYRDLRDVAISQSFHVISESENSLHSGKELYRAMPNQEARIIACINGVKKYAGLIERWELYAPWLDVDWVHPLRFEDMRLEPIRTSLGYTRYVYKRMAEVNRVDVEPSEAEINTRAFRMAMAMEERGKVSPTFRRGIPGQWREYWTDKIDKAFDKAGGHEWNQKLGYEDGK